MDRKQVQQFLTLHDNNDYKERLNTPENIEAILSANQQDQVTIANSFIVLQKAGLLGAMRHAVVSAGENAVSVAVGLELLSDAGILETDSPYVIAAASNGRSVGLGLACLERAEIIDKYRQIVIMAGPNAGAIGKGLEIAHKADFISEELLTIVGAGEHAYSVAMGLDCLEQEDIRLKERNRVIAAGQYAVSVGAALALLNRHNKLQEYRDEVLKNPENAMLIAELKVSGEQQLNPARIKPTDFLRRVTQQKVITADDVLKLANSPGDFYKLPEVTKGMYDVPGVDYDSAHTGPEIRQMGFLFQYLQEEKLIPNTKDSILKAINNLVDFANNLKPKLFLGELALDDTRRMFKLGVDRLLRKNERITQSQEWSSRALILGIFNGIQKYEQCNPSQLEIINSLYTAFILGVRQVVEDSSDRKASGSVRKCADKYCKTAASEGFFASPKGEAINSNEVYNLTAVNPACHGRLKNLSIELATFIGYPESVFEQIKSLIFRFTIIDYNYLQAKIQSVIDAGLTADSFKMTNSEQDKQLYSLGIDTSILSFFVQLKMGIQIDGLSSGDRKQVNKMLEVLEHQAIEKRKVANY